MRKLMSGPVDPAKELRLRRWARMNYVPESERKGSWHPIVLDEMKIRDLEKSEEHETMPPSSHLVYVPLEPTGTHELHGAHQLPEEPKYQRISKPVEHWILG